MVCLKYVAVTLAGLTAFYSPAARAANTQEADTIVLNADIRTVDPAKPRADALAVKDGRFVAVGTAAFVNDLRGPATKVIDAGGRTVTPGFADAHAHLMLGMELKQGVDLAGMQDFSQWLEAIRNKDSELPGGVWMIGGRWDSTVHTPTRQELDALVPDRPVALYNADYHALWVNSVALERAGINGKTKAPAGGEIVVDAEGLPTGLLKETAAQLVFNSDAFKKAKVARAEDFREVVKHYNSLGVTSVHDMSEDITVYEKFLREGSFNLRLWYGLMPPTDDRAMQPEHFATLAASQKRINHEMAGREKKQGLGPKFRFGFVKYFVDGTLALYTAALNAPYADRHDGFAGRTIQSRQQLYTLVAHANTAGFPVAIHAIGDKGVDLALDAFAQSPNGRGKFNRIEHVEVYSQSALKRFHELGVVASMQPHHAFDGTYQEQRLGAERLPRSYAWQSILTRGGMLVLGSDWPTAEESPLLQMGDAVLRERHGQRWHTHNALTFDEALYAYTQGPAIIAGWQKELGSISVGKLADFVILQGQIQDNAAMDIRDWQVDQTWLAGQKIYERQPGHHKDM